MMYCCAGGFHFSVNTKTVPAIEPQTAVSLSVFSALLPIKYDIAKMEKEKVSLYLAQLRES